MVCGDQAQVITQARQILYYQATSELPKTDFRWFIGGFYVAALLTIMFEVEKMIHRCFQKRAESIFERNNRIINFLSSA